jgi:predicted P-loop ATPase
MPLCFVAPSGKNACREQNLGKSLFFEKLAGKDHFTDSFSFEFDDKKIIEQTENVWLVEAGECHGLKTRDIEHVKALVTRTHDKARKSYGRITSNVPRQFVIVATSNPAAIFSDHTGGRRWNIIKVEGLDLEALERDREQLFAEAAEQEKSYGPLVLPEEVLEEARVVQEQHRIVNPVHVAISDVLEDRSGFVDAEEIYQALGLADDKKNLRHRREYAEAIKEVTAKLGWREYRPRKPDALGKRPRGFVKYPGGSENVVPFPGPNSVSAGPNSA